MVEQATMGGLFGLGSLGLSRFSANHLVDSKVESDKFISSAKSIEGSEYSSRLDSIALADNELNQPPMNYKVVGGSIGFKPSESRLEKVEQAMNPAAHDLSTRLNLDSEAQTRPLSANIVPHEKVTSRYLEIPRLLQSYGASAELIDHIQNNKNEFIDKVGVAKFMGKDPHKNLPIVERLIEQDAGADLLNPYRLESYVKLADALGKDSKEFGSLLKHEQNGVHLADAHNFVTSDDDNISVLKQLLNANVTAEHLTYRGLTGYAQILSALGPDSPLLRKIIDLDPTKIELDEVAHFIKTEPYISEFGEPEAGSRDSRERTNGTNGIPGSELVQENKLIQSDKLIRSSMLVLVCKSAESSSNNCSRKEFA